MTTKTTFFEGWSWFKFNNLGLAPGITLKFYISVKKGFKLKFRRFLGLIPTFVEVTGEKMVGEGGCFPPHYFTEIFSSRNKILGNAFAENGHSITV